MAKVTVKGQGTKQKPWILKTPSGQSEFQVYRDETLDHPRWLSRSARQSSATIYVP